MATVSLKAQDYWAIASSEGAILGGKTAITFANALRTTRST
jgi:hypothetical protein